MKVQFNVRLPKSTVKRIAEERKNLLQTNDIIAAVAFENFFTAYRPERRHKFYRAHGTPYLRTK